MTIETYRSKPGDVFLITNIGTRASKVTIRTGDAAEINITLGLGAECLIRAGVADLQYVLNWDSGPTPFTVIPGGLAGSQVDDDSGGG